MTNPDSIDPRFDFEDLAVRPAAKTYIKHLLLLLLTFVTVTIAGTLYPFGPFQTLPESDPQSVSEVLQMILYFPVAYASLVSTAVSDLFTKPENLIYGLKFSVSLLFILISHEMGHYVTCRLYKVDATLPFFIPTPPMVGPAGTFGAFIKIQSPMPSRRSVFDIGVSGPIAGFIALIPVAVIAFATMKPASPQVIAAEQSGILFSEPLFIKILAYLSGMPSGEANAFYYAAWVGLLVTALNLIPSGQLDGGHAIFAVLGERIHFWTGRIAFVVMATLSILGMYFYGSPSGLLIAVILGVMLRIRHPVPYDQTPLGAKRIAVAALTLLIFVLCFSPFPIQIKF